MLKVHIRRTLFAAIVAGLLGFLVAYRSPKIYEATVELLAGSPQIQADQSMPVEVKKVLLPGIVTDLDSDTGMIKSQRMFSEGLHKAALERAKPDLEPQKAFQELYPMFDLDVPQSLNQYAPDQQRVVRIRVKAYSPDDAASIANNVALSFAAFRKKRAADAVRDALDMVSTSAKKAKIQLDNIDKQYRALKTENTIGDLPSQLKNYTDALEAQKTRQNSTLADLAGAQAELASLQTQMGAIPPTINGQEARDRDPILINKRQLEAQAENDLADLRTRYLDDSPLVKTAKEKYEKFHKDRVDAEKSLGYVKASQAMVPNPVYTEMKVRVAGARARVQNLRSTLAPINAAIQDYSQRITSTPGIETKFIDLQRDRLVYEEQYQKNQKWVEDLKTARDGATSQIQSLADPTFITDPVAPDAKKYVVLSAIVGCLIGLAYSFALESFRLPVHTSWQLAELTALPVAASVPMMPKPLARRHYGEIKDGTFKPIESFRYMAFSMMAKESRPQVLLFTGVGEDVDSSGAAAEFAVAMAKTGSRTVLVDCDLRLPRLSEMFNVNSRSGVAEILGRTILPGESTDLFVSTEHDNLMILPAGAASSSGLSDFLTSHMSGLIDDLRGKADTVVINCPPVDVFADASRLAQYVDETCLVISAKTTSYRAIPVAQEILTKSGAKEMSIVLTNASPTEEPFGARSGVSTARR